MKSAKTRSLATYNFLETPFLIIITTNVFLLGLIVLLGLQKQVVLYDLFKDPAAFAEMSPIVGMFSNIGILLWCATATMCFLCSLMLQQAQKKRNTKVFLLCSGFISLILLLDDLFMLHEQVFPNALHIPEKMIYLIYGCIFTFYLVRFRATILGFKTRGLFGLSLCLLLASVVIDKIPAITFIVSSNLQPLIEDTAKLFGISTWFAFFLTLCWDCSIWLQLPEGHSGTLR